MQRYLRAAIRRLGVAGLCLSLASVAGLAKAATEDTILVLGDSISAAYGMSLDQGWVAKLQQRLMARALPHAVVNASISGDTTGGGLQRLPKLLERHQPAIVILELGGNDGLRGNSIAQLRANLHDMTTMAQATGARVLLLPMELPPNLGPRYTRLFRESYPLVAGELNATLGGFLLDGVALDPTLMQADGIHPTIEAQLRLLDNVWVALEPLLEEQTP